MAGGFGLLTKDVKYVDRLDMRRDLREKRDQMNEKVRVHDHALGNSGDVSQRKDVVHSIKKTIPLSEGSSQQQKLMSNMPVRSVKGLGSKCETLGQLPVNGLGKYGLETGEMEVDNGLEKSTYCIPSNDYLLGSSRGDMGGISVVGPKAGK
ncbi:hypothetical protein Q3G72_031493 [Acer saccharum]|nr:hypothetical protein Q3G72_031493 [Acer saccharum]